jgi:hypothetical protein
MGQGKGGINLGHGSWNRLIHTRDPFPQASDALIMASTTAAQAWARLLRL